MAQDAVERNHAGRPATDAARRRLLRLAVGLAVLGLATVLAVTLAAGATSAQEVPQSTAAATPWATNFCLTPAQCVTGDFNGDKKEDILEFRHSWFGNPGEVWVRLSNGTAFDPPQLWHSSFCVPNNRVCKVGDFNGDGMDDIIEFHRGTGGNVSVALSWGYSFGPSTVWTSVFCLENEICDVGDYNGDGNDDISTFTRSLYTDKGRVWVALSNGASAFGSSNVWASFFCIEQELCGSGDFNGDGKDDVITFSKNYGPVYVALSTGTKFDKGSNTPWRDFFCPGQEVCGVSDFNGDRKDDIVTYLRSSYATNPDPNARKIGHVYVALSDGAKFLSGQLWNNFFCIGGEICGSGNYIDGVPVTSYSQVSRTGDFNYDGRADAITFLRSTDLTNKPGHVYVGLSTGSSFVDTLPPTNTPTPTLTPTVTSTPTVTNTPTITPTPMPPRVWLPLVMR